MLSSFVNLRAVQALHILAHLLYHYNVAHYRVSSYLLSETILRRAVAEKTDWLDRGVGNIHTDIYIVICSIYRYH